jgi:hypothetical protein
MDDDRTNKGRQVRRVWVMIAIAAILAPPFMSVLSYLVLTVFAGDVDVAVGFGLSVATVNAITAVLGGLLAGAAVAFLARPKGWRFAVPPLAGAGVGLFVEGIKSATGAVSTSAPWFVWGAQSIAIFISIVLVAYQDGESQPPSQR